MIEKEIIITRENLSLTNNFWTRIPDDNYPPIAGEPKIRPGFLRNLVDEQGRIDRKIGDRSTISNLPSSDLYVNQTYREFFLTIDNLVEEFGLREKVQTLFDENYKHDRNPEIMQADFAGYSVALGDSRVPLRVRELALLLRKEADAYWYVCRDKIVMLCLPVFRRMLEMGYTMRDLTS